MSGGDTRPFLRSEYSTTINNAHQLQLVAMNLGATYTLGSNISMTTALAADGSGNYNGMWGASGFSPIGNATPRFTGSFNGQNHTITGLTINRPTTDWVGLFGINNGTIQNVGLVGGSTVGQDNVGALVGGLVGKIGGTVTKSYAAGSVTATSGTQVGGFAGQTDGIVVINSFWDTQATHQSAGISNTSPSTLTGKTTAQMISLATYTAGGVNAWSIAGTGGAGATWRIYDGSTYPLLTAFLTPITATYASASKTYDGAVYGGAFGTPPLSISGASLSGSATVVGNATSAVNAGSYGGTGSYYSSQTGYDVSYAGALTINPRVVTLTGSKAYDGTTSAPATILTVTNLVGADNAGLSGTGVLAAKDAGSEALTLSGGALAGLSVSNGNYTVTGGSGTVTVNKAALSVSGVSIATRTYDGAADVNAPLTGTAAISGSTYDSLTLATGSAAGNYADGNAGAGNAATVTGYALSGTGASNYTLAHPTGLTGTIDKAALSVSGVSIATRTYDGAADVNAPLTGTAAISGSTYDALTLATGSAAGTYADGNAGAGKAATVTGYALSGTGASTYTLAQPTGLTGTIGKAALSVTANNDSKTYDGLAYSGGNAVTYAGFVNSETSAVLSGTLSYRGTSKSAAKAGSYVITPQGLTSGNYASSFADGALTIAQRSIQVTAAPQTKQAGQADPTLTYALTAGALVAGDSLSGLLGRLAGESTGIYPINQGTLAASSNYALAFIGANLTIGAGPAPPPTG